ncbi:MAG: NFACT RNA binding domain-containing protein [Treponema sp.]
MSLNCREIDEIIRELALDGSYIQDVVQPGFDTLALYTYGKGGAKTVLICTAQNACRIHETRRKISRNDKPLRFMEFLKSKIKGAKIESVTQVGLERVIEFKLLCGGEPLSLFVRLWNNAANVVLCNPDFSILDVMFRRPAKGEVSGGVFTLPEKRADAGEEKVWPIRDFSELNEKLRTQNGSSSEPLSFNRKVDLWYGEYAASLSRKALLAEAQKWYEGAKTRMEGALSRLVQKQNEFTHAERYKTHGDLILSNAHLLDGKSKFLECADYTTGKTVRILIDPKKSAQENAALCYETYKKQKSGAQNLVHDIEILETKLQRLEKQYDSLIKEENPVKIEQLLRKSLTPKQKIKKAHPGLDYTVDGWYILVGRTAEENDELLRRHVRGSDLWLHVRDFAGGYVFIKSRAGKTVPLEILLDAANLAVHYSKVRGAGKADLYYTNVKYLRRAKNAPKGTVLPTHEKNLCITPDKERLARLDKLQQEEEL